MIQLLRDIREMSLNKRCPWPGPLGKWMDPYCPYGSLLSLWFPIVLMVPYCPYGSLLSWIHLVLDPSCPGSLLSWIHFVLDPFCPGSFLSCLVRSRRSALQRKYRGRTWAMKWQWKKNTFPANGTKKRKKIGRKIAKKSNIAYFGSSYELLKNYLYGSIQFFRGNLVVITVFGQTLIFE